MVSEFGVLIFPTSYSMPIDLLAAEAKVLPVGVPVEVFFTVVSERAEGR